MNHSLKQGDSMSAGVGSDSDKPYSDVRDYVGQLEAQTDALNSIVSSIRNRLEPVLRPESPTAGDAKAGLCAVGPSSPLACQLSNVLDANARTLSELYGLIDRLQV